MTVAFETAHDIEQQIRQAIAARHSRRWRANRWARYGRLGWGNRNREVGTWHKPLQWITCSRSSTRPCGRGQARHRSGSKL